jgi:hypothetical protein
MQRPSATIRTTALCAIACITAAAIAAPSYEVEVKGELNGLPIRIVPEPFDGRLVMKLTNDGDAKVRCDLRYDASPQPIRRSYVYLKPGETAENSFQAQRQWFSVTVDVTCKLADK